MKYKLKRDLPWAKAGTLVDADFARSGNGNISYSFVAQKGEYEGKEIWQGWYPKQYGDWSDWFEEVDGRWKPKKDEMYLVVTCEGDIYSAKWDGGKYNEDRYEFGNCFRAPGLAEKAAEEIKALLKEFHKNNP